MEKRFAVLAAIGSFVILSLLIVFLLIYSGSNDICTSKECVKAANELLTHLDPSVAPCNDFYEFTCGNFLRSTEEQVSAHITDRMRYAKSSKIRQLIEEPSGMADSKVLFKTKSFYKACINETAIEVQGLDGIRRVLDNIGGWPLLERGDWRENYFDWKNSTYYLRSVGFNLDLLINIDVGVNKQDTTRNIILIEPGTQDTKAMDNKHKKNYHEYMTEAAQVFGAIRREAEHDAKEVIEFRTQLRRIASEENSSSIKYPEPYNQRILSQIQYDFPGVSWVDYVNGVLYPGASVTSDDVVGMVNPAYIKKFIQLLNRTPKRVLANVICWNVIQQYGPYLPKKLQQLTENFKEKIGHKPETREEACTSITYEKMPEGVEFSYVKKYVSDDALRLTKGIIDYIKKELNKIIDNLDWLDSDAKEVAREKLASTKDYIAHTQEAPSRRKLDLIYDEVRINQENFLATVQNVDLMNLNLKYKKLIEPVHADDEHDELAYSIKENTLLLPSYYLQGLFFDENRPQYMNYGAIGTIIAYQLSNLFLEGRRYDLYGNLREWSTSQSLFNYDTRTKCISEQYKEFYIPGLGRNVNSTLTQEDDVALYFGKIVAYEAYRLWSESHDTEQPLPGLSYTQKQLFWISSAMYECSRGAPEEFEDDIATRRRSVARNRVIGPLRNSEGFARDFNCPSNSYMNPAEKCLLWQN